MHMTIRHVVAEHYALNKTGDGNAFFTSETAGSVTKKEGALWKKKSNGEMFVFENNTHTPLVHQEIKDKLIYNEKEIEKIESSFNLGSEWSKGSKDDSGTFRVVTKMTDDKIPVTSTLSNPDSSGLYKTRTLEYGRAGDSKYRKVVYNLTYDADGDVIKQTLK